MSSIRAFVLGFAVVLSLGGTPVQAAGADDLTSLREELANRRVSIDQLTSDLSAERSRRAALEAQVATLQSALAETQSKLQASEGGRTADGAGAARSDEARGQSQAALAIALNVVEKLKQERSALEADLVGSREREASMAKALKALQESSNTTSALLASTQSDLSKTKSVADAAPALSKQVETLTAQTEADRKALETLRTTATSLQSTLDDSNKKRAELEASVATLNRKVVELERAGYDARSAEDARRAAEEELKQLKATLADLTDRARTAEDKAAQATADANAARNGSASSVQAAEASRAAAVAAQKAAEDELKQLKTTLADLTQRTKAAEDRASSFSADAKTAIEARNVAARDREAASSAAVNLKAQVDDLAAKLKKVEADRDAALTSLSSSQASLKQYADAQSALQAKAGAAEGLQERLARQSVALRDYESTQSSLASAQLEIQQLRKQVGDLTSKHAESERVASTASGDAASLAAANRTLKIQLDEARAAARQREDAERKLSDLASVCASRDVATTKESASAKAQMTALTEQVSALSDQKRTLNDELQKAKGEADGLRKQLADAKSVVAMAPPMPAPKPVASLSAEQMLDGKRAEALKAELEQVTQELARTQQALSDALLHENALASERNMAFRKVNDYESGRVACPVRSADAATRR